MSAPKILSRFGAAGVIEASYAAGGTPTTTDGILPRGPLVPTLEYLHDGTLGASPLGGQMPRSGVIGMGATFDFETYAWLPGAAYSATVVPSVDKLLRSAGFKRTTVLTGGSESHSYASTTLVSEQESLFLRSWAKGQQYDVKGIYSDLTISADGPAPPVWTFHCSGIGAIPTDVVVPTTTAYPNMTVKPATATNIVLAIGAFNSAVVRGFELNLGREMSARANDNSVSGHQGYTPGNRVPMFTVTIESTPLATFDPYTAKDQATEYNTSFRIGSVQYRKYTVTMPKLQIVDVNETEDGNSAMWELVMAPAVTPPAGADDLTFLFD